MPYPHTLRIPYTLSLNAFLGRWPSGVGSKWGFIAEFDTEIEVGYEDTSNWEILGLRFEQTRFASEFLVTPESDKDLWKLIERAFEMEEPDLSTKINDLINEGYYDRHQNAREDAMADRYEEYR